MTGRTHDLAAFTALTYVITTQPMDKMTLATALVAFTANMIGGLAPDIDQPTATLWRRMRGGSFIGRLITPFLGGHRLISHSIIGIFLFSIVTRELLRLLGTFVLVDMDIVWWAFMIGFISHIFMDMFTREGVPLLFPIPINFGIPPFRFTRFKTGGLTEKSFVFPGLLILNAFLYYRHYGVVVDFLRNLTK